MKILKNISILALMMFTFAAQARATVADYGTGVGLVLQVVCHPKTGIADVQFAEFDTLIKRTTVYYYNLVNAEICQNIHKAKLVPSGSFKVYGPHLQNISRNRDGIVKEIQDVALLTAKDVQIFRGLQVSTGHPANLQEAQIIDNRYIQAGLSDQYPAETQEVLELAKQSAN